MHMNIIFNMLLSPGISLGEGYVPNGPPPSDKIRGRHLGYVSEDHPPKKNVFSVTIIWVTLT